MPTLAHLRHVLFSAVCSSAKTHGEDDDPEHEIGDLQDALSTLLPLLRQPQLEMLLSTMKTRQDGFDVYWQERAGSQDALPVGAVQSAIFAAAKEHGQQDDPDHEVGDLQDALRGALADADREQLTQFLVLLRERQDGLEEPWALLAVDTPA